MNWLAALIITVAVASAACNRPGCSGASYDPKPHDPVITQMSYMGQEEDNPWTVLLALNFTSPLGNLGNGEVKFYANSQSPSSPMDLSTYFNASNVSLDATSGLIAIPLPFAQVGFDYDATVRLGTEVVDADNRPSNCYTMDLNFTLSLAGSWLRDTFKDLRDARRRV